MQLLDSMESTRFEKAKIIVKSYSTSSSHFPHLRREEGASGSGASSDSTGGRDRHELPERHGRVVVVSLRFGLEKNEMVG